MTERVLIVTADDFGRSRGVNAGVFTAHERGIVTSASLMVRWPAAAEAGAYSRRCDSLSVGLHLDLGEWRRDGDEWRAVYEVVPLHDPAAVSDEIKRQLLAFEALVGTPPTHLDSHQHVHRSEPARFALAEAGAMLRIPVRDVTPSVRYSGTFYADPCPDAVTVTSLVSFLDSVPPGVTELGCHPGIGADFESAYSQPRHLEVETLCDPRVREAIEGLQIELRSFAELNIEPS